MKIKPMIFNTEMVKALLDGRKTVTRRPIPDWQKAKQCENDDGYLSIAQRDPRYGFSYFGKTVDEVMSQFSASICPFGKVGDLLYVRETFRYFESEECGCSDSPCGCPKPGSFIYLATQDGGEGKWKPSIHMPRKVSRLTLKITDVRVERIQSLDEEQARREGYPLGNNYNENPNDWFSKLWDSVYGNWEDNDYVWVVEFEVIHSNVDVLTQSK